MSLIERLRPASAAGPIPDGARVGQRLRRLTSQRHTGVGVDFGAGGLKVAQVRWTGDGPRLENYAVVPVPPASMDEGAVADPVAMGDLLRSTLQSMGVKQGVVGAAVGGPAIMMRYINLPKVPLSEMRSAMKFEAPQHLPIQEDQLVFDFSPVPEAVSGTENQTAVFLAGTHKRLVDSFVAALSHAGLRPDAIELDCLATHRALQWTGLIPHESVQPLVLIDVGEVATRISIMRYGVPMLSRSIPTGMYHLRAAIADTRQISLPEAEELLRTRGAAVDDDLTAAVEPLMGTLLEAITRSVEFFLIQHRSSSLEHIFLSGGGAMLPMLPEVMSRHLRHTLSGRPEIEKLKVQPAGLAGLDVNATLLPDVSGFGPLLMTAVGSALRGG